MKAFLKNYRQSPRKVRLVADLIRGKKVDEAETVLDFTVKRSSRHFKQLLNSAVANAKQNFGLEKDVLFIKEVQVNKGVTLKRFRPVSRGSAHPINKRSSHVLIVLGEQPGVKQAQLSAEENKKAPVKTKETTTKKKTVPALTAKRDEKKTVKKSNVQTKKETTQNKTAKAKAKKSIKK